MNPQDSDQSPWGRPPPPHPDDRLPWYDPPQYGPPQPPRGQGPYGQPQYGQPQYGQPQYGQPQYGQPQYGPPGASYPTNQPGPTPGPTHRIDKKALGILAAVVALALIASGVVWAFSQLGTHKLSHRAVEQTIETQSADPSESFRPITGVRCNDGMDIAVSRNASFTCTAAGSLRITVMIKSSSHNPGWVWAVD